jgi:DNA-directed RNA polymerase subunit RPC12/RpoP
MAKTKYISFECPYCHRLAKLEYIGLASEKTNETSAQRAWYRCARCKHSVLIAVADVESRKKSASTAIVRDNCTPYSKEKKFTIGQEIYHEEWDDVGRIVRKDKTSNGVQTIVVAFEKSGEKKLIENLALEEAE